MNRAIVLWVLIVLLSAPVFADDTIGFIEDFSLDKDREEALKQLIPGTPDYYYYHCLHLQNQKKFDEAQEMLAMWIKRHEKNRTYHNLSGRIKEIMNRQSLLQFDKDPAKAYGDIRHRLRLHFNHQRDQFKETSHPTKLDQRLISRERLYGHRDYEDAAFDWVIRQKLSGDRLRTLLGRLRRPDYPKLPELVVRDLAHRKGIGFGHHRVHGMLLKSQLDKLIKLKRDLLNDTQFVNTYLVRLQPPSCEDWHHHAESRAAYLNRLWVFVSRLNPSHNSLKVHVLYHRLVHDRALGVWDQERFMQYLALPRSAVYVNPKYVSTLRNEFFKAHQKREPSGFWASFAADYRAHTMLPPVGSDEPLIRSYLAHFFVDEEGYQTYEKYLKNDYLKAVFAETKIVNGIGDMEQWYSMLDNPSRYQQIKERIDIDFVKTSKAYFKEEDPVTLDLYIKNVETLLVKVFEINALNYYQQEKKEIDTSINLDGLVANQEKTYTYTETPFRRVRRTFEFPGLKKAGVFIVEFIGSGQSSRAMIQKGTLRFLERSSVAGHVFTIMNEDNEHIKDAGLILGGHEYRADEDGYITVPFSTKPGHQKIILKHGDLAVLDRFQHKAERYQLEAGIHVDRETLLAGRQATVIVRPGLLINGERAALDLLEDVTFTITSRDHSGVETTKTITDFELFEDRDATSTFTVPAALNWIGFALRAKVQPLSRDEKDNLIGSKGFAVNRIDHTEKVEDLHLGLTDEGYVLYLLGKSGEIRPKRPIYLKFKHRLFKSTVDTWLQTDRSGRVELGEMKDIEWFNARGPEGTQHTWLPAADSHSYAGSIHGKEGTPVTVPYMGRGKRPEATEFSLLELRGGKFYRDRLGAVSLKDGLLVINGLPAGDHDLVLKEKNRRISICIDKGEYNQGYVLAENRLLEVKNPAPLQIDGVGADRKNVTVRLKNASAKTRVHLLATYFVPGHSAYGNLLFAATPPLRITQGKEDSFYLEGRAISDEYRYILERRLAKKFPGNMLKRPSLLLFPWSLEETTAGIGEGRAGERFGARKSKGKRRAEMRGRGARDTGELGAGAFANLDFLASAGTVHLNLRPDKQGSVVISRKELGGRHHIQVIAVDADDTVMRQIALGETPLAAVDLRLEKTLDTQKHFVEEKKISVLRPGDKPVTQDASPANEETYDSIAGIYRLFTTLSGSATLAEFSFIVDWPDKKETEQRELYSKYACHELNFFLSRKDPEFFEKVIVPALGNKKDKTFMDLYLLGADLEGFRRPWEYLRLNVAERVLLARRSAAAEERGSTARHLKDVYELQPPDIERANHLFKTALQGSALEPGVDIDGEAGGFELREAIDDMADARPAIAMARKPKAPAPRGAPRPPEKKMKEVLLKAEEEEPLEEAELDVKGDEARRRAVRRFYRKLEATQEWAENNYWHLLIEDQNEALVSINPFWRDYAEHDGKGPFLSPNIAHASRNFTEIMLALAVTDLPFSAKGADVGRIVFHKQIQAVDERAPSPVLVSQHFFNHSDRYKTVEGERQEKYVTQEFVVSTVYGCQIVLTNPSSATQKVDVLLQIPEDSLPVLNGFYTDSRYIRLEPHGTQKLEYHFYFPQAGSKRHFPVHVAENGKLVTFTAPFKFNVVAKLTDVDTEAWDYISQRGTEQQVLFFLENRNIQKINLPRIAWRVRDKKFFRRALAILHRRHVYDHTLWSYGIHHQDLPSAREYLKHCDTYLRLCGDFIDTALITIDPVERLAYQHLEYSPLVNPRAHRLGARRKILNHKFHTQYHRLMKILSYRGKLSDTDRMAVTYYLLLQDRIEEALEFFAVVDAKKLATELQYDYMKAYISFYQERPQIAEEIAAAYKDYPVDRWRKVFNYITNQVDEIKGRKAVVSDDKDRTQTQTQLAATSPGFDFKVESRKIHIDYQNLSKIRVNYYKMDLEMMFSNNPFVQERPGQFAFIRPNSFQELVLPEDKRAHTFELPEEYHSDNVMVEAIGAGQSKTCAYYANSLAVQIVENYGHLRVTHKESGKALPRVYVKVYARTDDGDVEFYKDGYTDLRGRFDYASLNSDKINETERFALLIQSEHNGATIREVAPPKQ